MNNFQVHNQSKSNHNKNSKSRFIQTCETNNTSINACYHIYCIEQEILRQQIKQHSNKNLHKLFPSLLKQMSKLSQKHNSVQIAYNNQKQKDFKEIHKTQEKILQLQTKIQQIQEQELYFAEQEKIKLQYEKQLLLGCIDITEYKVQQLNLTRQQINSHRNQLLLQKSYLQQSILQQKTQIHNMAIKKTKILEQLKYIKTCQIQPIHFTHQKLLKSLQEKTLHFQQQYAHQQTGKIFNTCDLQDKLTINQFPFDPSTIQLTQQGVLLTQHIHQKQKVDRLNNKLNILTCQRIQKQILLNIQAQKQTELKQKIIKTQFIVYQYQSLLQQVNNEQIYYSQQGQHVSMIQLKEQIQSQRQQKQKQTEKFTLLMQRLNQLKHQNFKLSSFVQNQKQQQKVIANRLLYQNQSLKCNLQQTRRQHRLLDKNHLTSRNMQIKQEKVVQLNKAQINILFKQRNSNINRLESLNSNRTIRNPIVMVKQEIKPVTQDSQINLQLKQLRNRLKIKFQQQTSRS